MEELFFRGVLWTEIFYSSIGRLSKRRAALFSGLLFAITHKSFHKTGIVFSLLLVVRSTP